jgi:hypothetical protein
MEQSALPLVSSSCNLFFQSKPIKMFVLVICVSTNLYSTVFPQFLVGSFVGSPSIVSNQCYMLRTENQLQLLANLLPIGDFPPFLMYGSINALCQRSSGKPRREKNGERFLTSITY